MGIIIEHLSYETLQNTSNFTDVTIYLDKKKNNNNNLKLPVVFDKDFKLLSRFTSFLITPRNESLIFAAYLYINDTFQRLFYDILIFNQIVQTQEVLLIVKLKLNFSFFRIIEGHTPFFDYCFALHLSKKKRKFYFFFNIQDINFDELFFVKISDGSQDFFFCFQFFDEFSEPRFRFNRTHIIRILNETLNILCSYY